MGEQKEKGRSYTRKDHREREGEGKSIGKGRT
jgi:hypothetical protein